MYYSILKMKAYLTLKSEFEIWSDLLFKLIMKSEAAVTAKWRLGIQTKLHNIYGHRKTPGQKYTEQACKDIEENI